MLQCDPPMSAMLTQHTALDEACELRPDVPPLMPMHSTDFGSPSGTDQAMWSNVDLGEFMMDNDLDFLGRMFNFSHSHNATVRDV